MSKSRFEQVKREFHSLPLETRINKAAIMIADSKAKMIDRHHFLMKLGMPHSEIAMAIIIAGDRMLLMEARK